MKEQDKTYFYQCLFGTFTDWIVSLSSSYLADIVYELQWHSFWIWPVDRNIGSCDGPLETMDILTVHKVRWYNLNLLILHQLCGWFCCLLSIYCLVENASKYTERMGPAKQCSEAFYNYSVWRWGRETINSRKEITPWNESFICIIVYTINS